MPNPIIQTFQTIKTRVFTPITSLFSRIFGRFSSLFNKILNLVWRVFVPILLVGLIVVPIYLTYFPADKKSGTPTAVAQTKKMNITKKISVQGTTEYTQQYDLPVYQDSTLTEILVKEGDKVIAGQVLAKLDFVNENKVRSTAVENAIKLYQQEIANNNRALGDAGAIANANYDQMDTNTKNRAVELEELNQRRIDKIKELDTKKSKYITEKEQYQREYNSITAFGDVTTSIKTYQDQLDSFQNQKNNSQGDTSYFTNQINDLQKKIDELNQSGYTNSNYRVISQQETKGMITLKALPPVSNEPQNKTYSTGVSNAITDIAKSGNLTKQKTDLQKEIDSRTTWIKQIDDNVEVKAYDEQILAKQKIIDELLASQNLTKQNLNQANSNIIQRNASANVNISNSKNSLSDTLEDIAKQEKNKTITAKSDGIVGKIYKDQGLNVNARENIFSMTSEDFRLSFTISADNRSQIKTGMKVVADKYKEVDNITITNAPTVADISTVATTTVNYTIKAKLPKTDKYQYTSGENVNLDVIINQENDTLSVPSSAVGGGKVYIGISPDSRNIKQQTDTKKTIEGIKFESLKEVVVETGLDDGRNIQIKSGINDGDYVVVIYPKSEKDLNLTKKDLLKN